MSPQAQSRPSATTGPVTAQCYYRPSHGSHHRPSHGRHHRPSHGPMSPQAQSRASVTTGLVRTQSHNCSSHGPKSSHAHSTKSPHARGTKSPQATPTARSHHRLHMPPNMLKCARQCTHGLKIQLLGHAHPLIYLFLSITHTRARTHTRLRQSTTKPGT